MDKLTQSNIIKSTSQSQEEILRWIISLYCPDGFEVDPTYSKGNFYKSGVIPQPTWKSDIDPQGDDVLPFDFTDLPYDTESIKSIIFDPPFIGGHTKGGKPGIIKERFGCYNTIPILWEVYFQGLSCFYRILTNNGILVVICQDSVENHRQYLTHIKLTIDAIKLGFYPLDLFVLTASGRIISQKTQTHARKYHSYFIVFKKCNGKVKYGNSD